MFNNRSRDKFIIRIPFNILRDIRSAPHPYREVLLYLSLVVRESIFLHSSILSSILYQLVACPQPSSVLQHLIEHLISCTPLPVRFVQLWQFFFLQHLIEHLIGCTRFLSDSFCLAILHPTASDWVFDQLFPATCQTSSLAILSPTASGWAFDQLSPASCQNVLSDYSLPYFTNFYQPFYIHLLLYRVFAFSGLSFRCPFPCLPLPSLETVP